MSGTQLARLGLFAKAGLGASLVAAGVAGAGAAGALPAPADHAVRGAIEVVSPLDFSEHGDGNDAGDDGDAGSQAPDRFGAQVSADATGESDGTKGVDGPTIAAEAPGADHRADPAAPGGPSGPSGETGLRRANQTPAAPHAPDTVPPQARPTGAGVDHPKD